MAIPVAPCRQQCGHLKFPAELDGWREAGTDGLRHKSPARPAKRLGTGAGPEFQDSGDASANGSAWLFHWIWKFLHRQPGQPDCNTVGGLCRRADVGALELWACSDPRTASSDR